jgi:hypothetical protein
MTTLTHEVMSADGDDYVRVGTGEAELFANQDHLLGEADVLPDTGRVYEMVDVGTVLHLAGRAAAGWMDPGLRTDRQMPRLLHTRAQVARAAVRGVRINPN